MGFAGRLALVSLDLDGSVEQYICTVCGKESSTFKQFTAHVEFHENAIIKSLEISTWWKQKGKSGGKHSKFCLDLLQLDTDAEDVNIRKETPNQSRNVQCRRASPGIEAIVETPTLDFQVVNTRRSSRTPKPNPRWQDGIKEIGSPNKRKFNDAAELQTKKRRIQTKEDLQKNDAKQNKRQRNNTEQSPDTAETGLSDTANDVDSEHNSPEKAPTNPDQDNNVDLDIPQIVFVYQGNDNNTGEPQEQTATADIDSMLFGDDIVLQEITQLQDPALEYSEEWSSNKSSIKRKHEETSTPVSKKRKNAKTAMFECKLCTWKSDRHFNYHRHMLAHLGSDKNFICNYCHKDIYVDKKKSGYGMKRRSCEQCSLFNVSEVTYEIHMFLHHGAERPNRKFYHCETCKFWVFREALFEKHKTLCGGRGKKIKSEIRNEPADSDTSVDVFCCSECTYTSTNKYALNMHVHKVHTEKPVKVYKCHLCNTERNALDQMKDHLYTEHKAENPVVCDHCGFSTTSTGALEVHNKMLHSHRPIVFVCTLCGYIALSKEIFMLHNSVHVDNGDLTINESNALDSAHADEAHESQGNASQETIECQVETSTGNSENIGTSKGATHHICETTSNQHENDNETSVSELDNTNLSESVQFVSNDAPVKNACSHKDIEDRSSCDICIPNIVTAKMACSECSFVGQKHMYYRSHVSSHIPKPELYRYCQFCLGDLTATGARATLALLNYHIKENHPQEEPFHQCNTCGYIVYSREELLAHKKEEHKVTEMYPCNMCSHVSNFKKNLRLHMADLHKDKVHCEYCDYDTRSKVNMHSHYTKVHMIEAPDYLKDFMSTYNRKIPFVKPKAKREMLVCEICGKECQRCNYKMHMDSHDKSREYRCHVPNCTFKSYNTPALSRHVKKHKTQTRRLYRCKQCHIRGYRLWFDNHHCKQRSKPAITKSIVQNLVSPSVKIKQEVEDTSQVVLHEFGVGPPLGETDANTVEAHIREAVTAGNLQGLVTTQDGDPDYTAMDYVQVEGHDGLIAIPAGCLTEGGTIVIETQDVSQWDNSGVMGGDEGVTGKEGKIGVVEEEGEEKQFVLTGGVPIVSGGTQFIREDTGELIQLPNDNETVYVQKLK